MKTLLVSACMLSAAPCFAQQASIQIFNQPDVEEEGLVESAGGLFAELSAGEAAVSADAEGEAEAPVSSFENPFKLLRPSWARSSRIETRFAHNLSGATDCQDTRFYPFPGISGTAARRREAFFPDMARIACDAGIPVILFDALIVQESGYNPLIVSHAGARGLAQLMPDTARGLGVRNSFDPIENMRGGARYLRQQRDRFGSWRLALGAYNAGPGRIEQYGGLPPFRETQNYVRRITASVDRLSGTRLETPAFARVEPFRRARLLGFTAAMNQTSRNTLPPSDQINPAAISNITGVPLK